MSDGLDPLRDLHPPRLPEAFAALQWPELLAAFGLGILAALLIFELARPWLGLRRRLGIEERLTALRARPPEARILGLLALLRSLGVAPPEDLRAALYAPTEDSAKLAEALERAVRDAFAKADQTARRSLRAADLKAAGDG